MDATANAIKQATDRSSSPCTKATLIVSSAKSTPTNYSHIKLICSSLSNNFPETMARALVFPTTIFSRGIWHAVKLFLGITAFGSADFGSDGFCGRIDDEEGSECSGACDDIPAGMDLVCDKASYPARARPRLVHAAYAVVLLRICAPPGLRVSTCRSGFSSKVQASVSRWRSRGGADTPGKRLPTLAGSRGNEFTSSAGSGALVGGAGGCREGCR